MDEGESDRRKELSVDFRREKFGGYLVDQGRRGRSRDRFGRGRWWISGVLVQVAGVLALQLVDGVPVQVAGVPVQVAGVLVQVAGVLVQVAGVLALQLVDGVPVQVAGVLVQVAGVPVQVALVALVLAGRHSHGRAPRGSKCQGSPQRESGCCAGQS
ncbi:hypothetical protein Bbelb_193300 [Branchiostoma belcheri]|nr:hypothetical protein Bbelb_193300 [Branchiostoma belcheri]